MTAGESALSSGEITTPTPHHSLLFFLIDNAQILMDWRLQYMLIFTDWMLFLIYNR